MSKMFQFSDFVSSGLTDFYYHTSSKDKFHFSDFISSGPTALDYHIN